MKHLSICASLRDGVHGWRLHARTPTATWNGRHILALWFETRQEAETIKRAILDGMALDAAVHALQGVTFYDPGPRPMHGRSPGRIYRRGRPTPPFNLVASINKGRSGWLLRRRRFTGSAGPVAVHWFLDREEAQEVLQYMVAGMTLVDAQAAMQARILAECV